MEDSSKVQLLLSDGKPRVELLAPEEIIPINLDWQNCREIKARQVKPAKSQVIRVIWEFWRENQQRSYHGAPAIVDLGSIDD